MGTPATDKDDPLRLLPAEARRRWVVLPRYRLHQAVAFFFLLGASLALWIVGLALGIRWMMWTPPAIVVAFSVMNLFLRGREKQDEEDIRRHKVQDRAG